MTDQATGDDQEWPTHCPACGTELAQATIDMDRSDRDWKELRPGEMFMTDYCPNPDCPAKKPDPSAAR